MRDKLKEILSETPSYSEELGLNLSKTEDRFKWFIASIFFAKRISNEIAKNTFRMFIENGLTTPDKILQAGWDKLVEILDLGGYVRYDFSTATNLLKTTNLLKELYNGSLEELHKQAENSKDLEKRLKEFKGVGPVAINIFLRELRGIWDKSKPKVSTMALETAKRLDIEKDDIEVYESKLVRLKLEYCKKKKCEICPVKNYCKTPVTK
ncbi:MAG: hypothetical protein ACFE68_05105 [Candidatus Hodarchaeota archaeon]